MGLHSIPHFDGRTALRADALNRMVDQINRLSNIRGAGGVNIMNGPNGIIIGGSSPGTNDVYFANFVRDSGNSNSYLNSYPAAPSSTSFATRVYPAKIFSGINFTDNTAGGGGAWNSAGLSLPMNNATDKAVAVFNMSTVWGLQNPTFIPEGWYGWIYKVNDQYYTQYPFPKRVIGVLTSPLAQGGSASMLIHYLNNSNADTASPYTISTVFDYGLQTGGTIASGKKIFAYWLENQFNATIGTTPGFWVCDGAAPC